MTHQEIFDNLADDVKKALLSKPNTTWEDLRVEYAIKDPFHPGYVIVVWGEELEIGKIGNTDLYPDDTKCFSVSIHKATVDGNAGETLCTAFSGSPDLQDLENAVYAALRQLEHFHSQPDPHA